MKPRLAEVWSGIANDLGLELVVPFVLHLANGVTVDADALLKCFGGHYGTLMVDDYAKISEHTDAIVAAGYGYSVLPRYSDSYVYDCDETKKMLAEWTWTGSDESKPSWLDQIEPEDEG